MATVEEQQAQQTVFLQQQAGAVSIDGAGGLQAPLQPAMQSAPPGTSTAPPDMATLVQMMYQQMSTLQVAVATVQRVHTS